MQDSNYNSLPWDFQAWFLDRCDDRIFAHWEYNFGMHDIDWWEWKATEENKIHELVFGYWKEMSKDEQITALKDYIRYTKDRIEYKQASIQNVKALLDNQ